MKTKRVLFITQEILPYIEEGEYKLLGRKVPQFFLERGREIRTFMPKWGTVNERRSQLHEVIRLSGMNLIIDDTDHLLILKVASIPSARMQVYFIDNDDYFMKRLEYANEKGEEYSDNGERAIFYARGVLETIKKLRWVPDVIHCQGWISTIAPLYIKTAMREEPCFRDARIIFTPGGNELKRTMSPQFMADIQFKGVTPKHLENLPEQVTVLDLYKLALQYSDGAYFLPQFADPELLAYARQLKLPILQGPVEAEGAGTQITNFFDSVWSAGKEDI
ncbi:MAG: glycogen/starch synthase [Bacteroidaceae bacterium]|nr:glycogen/starch synthase [Bacteroidaceae bacterium]